MKPASKHFVKKHVVERFQEILRNSMLREVNKRETKDSQTAYKAKPLHHDGSQTVQKLLREVGQSALMEVFRTWQDEVLTNYSWVLPQNIFNLWNFSFKFTSIKRKIRLCFLYSNLINYFKSLLFSYISNVNWWTQILYFCRGKKGNLVTIFHWESAS